MPAISVWPVSSSVRTRKVGSSSARRCRPAPSLSWSAFVFGSTATEMTGSGNVHRLEQDRRRLDRERVAGGRVLEPDAGGDLARADLLALLAVVRVHLEDAADPLGLAGGRVQDAVAGLELAGVDAEVRQLADVRVGHDLEDERRERLVERRAARELVLGARVDAVDRRDVERARQVVDDRVEQRLDALVLEGGAEQHRRDRVVSSVAARSARLSISGVTDVLVDRGRSRAARRRARRSRRSAGGGTPAPARAARPGSRRRPSSCRGRRRRRSPASRRGRRRRGSAPPGRSGAASAPGGRRGGRPSTARR